MYLVLVEAVESACQTFVSEPSDHKYSKDKYKIIK